MLNLKFYIQKLEGMNPFLLAVNVDEIDEYGCMPAMCSNGYITERNEHMLKHCLEIDKEEVSFWFKKQDENLESMLLKKCMMFLIFDEVGGSCGELLEEDFPELKEDAILSEEKKVEYKKLINEYSGFNFWSDIL